MYVGMRRLEHLICTEIVLVGLRPRRPLWGLDGGLRTVLLLFCRGVWMCWPISLKTRFEPVFLVAKLATSRPSLRAWCLISVAYRWSPSFQVWIFFFTKYVCIYMPYPPQSVISPIGRYLFLPKSAHEQVKGKQCTACPVLKLHLQLQLHVCICSMHGKLPCLACCSHDLHVSCFPEGIKTDGHLGAPPSGRYIQ